ncbi:MAG TPA: DUF1961 family protein [Microlunatus sp.]|nr:DUF1961 family protein [Microlunatus sp.]
MSHAERRAELAEEPLLDVPARSAGELAGWVAEGPVALSDDGESVILGSADPDSDEHGHWTLWCPVELPDRVAIEWEFQPVSEPGLAMIFFAAAGTEGRDLFDPALPARDGHYPQYHSGAVRALHLSYLRHKWPEERAFRTCNVRKSPGFHLVAQAADPLPPAEDAVGFYRLRLIKDGADVRFSIDDLPVLHWTDDGTLNGGPYGGGRIGLRQMAPLVARYRGFRVTPLR